MTEVHVEHEAEEHHEDLAEAIAEAHVEAVHELQQEEDVEQAQNMAEDALQAVSEQAGHTHDEYALVGHTHPELDHSERLSILESRVEEIVHGLENEVEEPVVEEIEPTETHVEPEAPRKRHRFGR